MAASCKAARVATAYVWRLSVKIASVGTDGAADCGRRRIATRSLKNRSSMTDELLLPKKNELVSRKYLRFLFVPRPFAKSNFSRKMNLDFGAS